MNTGERITLGGIAFTLLLQVCTSTWWASNISTVQAQHTAWITEHARQQESYPVIEQRVTILEDTTERLLVKMDDLIGVLIDREKMP